jgi:predicted HAD superfamily Cof-like phosphohydrolase
MKDLINDVAEFHRAFGITVETSPTIPSPEVQKLRYDLALEELNEFREACKEGDIVEIFDAIVDQLYILLGTAATFGLSDALINGFKEVHKSNMTKLDSNGEVIRHPNGKVAKSELYQEPDLKQIIKEVYSS